MSRGLRFELAFAAAYEVEQLDRIDRSGGRRAYRFPGGVEVTAQQELAEGPIVGIAPEAGEPWVGVFHGGQYGVPPAASGLLIGWPDEVSFCVVYAGCGVVVQADDPTRTYEIDCYPITGTCAVSDQGIVVFADFTHMAAYDSTGLRWRSERLAWDDLKIVGVEGTTIHATGFHAPLNDAAYPFSVDLLTGESSDHPNW